MAKKDPAGKDAALAQRLRVLMVAEGILTQVEFAKKLGIEKQRLNNALTGHSLSIDVSQRIKRAVPGMTRDWLYDGDESGLTAGLRDKLREAATRLKAG